MLSHSQNKRLSPAVRNLLILIAAIIMCGSIWLDASGVVRTHRHKQIKGVGTGKAESRDEEMDSVRFTLTDTVVNGINVHNIIFTGYDKTQRSARESLYITNRTDRHITRITFEIAYYNSKGIEMHRRTVSVPVDLPAGTSRKVDFPSWDPQHSYYFHKSKPAKKPGNTYDVAIRLVSLRYHPTNPTP